jgi:hypothetical protein
MVTATELFMTFGSIQQYQMHARFNAAGNWAMETTLLWTIRANEMQLLSGENNTLLYHLLSL